MGAGRRGGHVRCDSLMEDRNWKYREQPLFRNKAFLLQNGALLLIPAHKYVAVFHPETRKHAEQKNKFSGMNVCEARETALSVTHSKQNLVFQVAPVTFE